MEYVERPKGNGCIFCAFGKLDEGAMRRDLVLHASERAFVVLNRYPFAAGHLLVVPKVHVADLEGLAKEDHDALFVLVRETTIRLKRAVRAEGFNIGCNQGAAAGAGIAEHLHVHVVPRWAGDTNFMPVLADVRVMPQYLEATFDKVVVEFADLPGRHPASSARE